MIFAMLKMEWQSLINSFKGLSDTTKLWTILAYVFIAIIGVPLIISVLSFGFANQSLDFQRTFLSYIFLYGGIIVFISTVTIIIKDFFIANDIKQLLLLPISIHQIFLVKMIKLFLSSVLWVYLLIGLTISILLYKDYQSMTIGILVMVSLLGFILFYLSLTFCFIFLLTKVLPKNKINEIMTGLLGIAGALFYFIIIGPANSIGKKLTPLTDYLPFNWVSDAVIKKQHSTIDVCIAVGVLLLGVLLFYLLTQLLMRYGQQDFTVESSTKVRSPKVQEGIDTAERSLMKKDFKLIVRDFKEISAILPQIIIPVPYVVFIIMQSGGVQELRAISELSIGVLLIGLAIGGTSYVATMIAARLTAKDAEQQDILYSLPINFKDVVNAKWKLVSVGSAFCFAIPIIIFGIVVKAEPLHIIYGVILCVITSFALTPLGIYFGTKEPQISKKTPSKRVGMGTSFLMLFCVGGIILFVVIMQTLLGIFNLPLNIRFLIFTVIMAVAGFFFYKTMMKKACESYEFGLDVKYVD
ncbi:putative ABC transporter permease subunit [Macrococcus lamae]|uniref:Uncharacterized protein n=1 Tax=Macrococcus lamae TaxID=198484 RepID=A0A4R6BWP8_9STAP|nr:hypothetical protein [Macrococcus lamae]TDM12800.1 hypothetical protein ERX29_02015 [Macrococcus lamae]